MNRELFAENMNRLTLRELKLSDRDKFNSAVAERWEPNFTFAQNYESIAGNSFDKYVRILPELAKGINLPREHVPSTLLFAFNVEGKLVGRVSIRHGLTEHLLNVGGHIGYGVVPSERRKGYATEILKEALIYVKEKLSALDRVLLTCDETNVGSIKTIEKNGGKFENIFKSPDMVVGKRRYWINIA